MLFLLDNCAFGHSAELWEKDPVSLRLFGHQLTDRQTVVPGFEFTDHNFMTADTMKDLVTAEQEAELRWLLRNSN